MKKKLIILAMPSATNRGYKCKDFKRMLCRYGKATQALIYVLHKSEVLFGDRSTQFGFSDIGLVGSSY